MMTDVTTLSILGVISSSLVGTGAIAFFVKYGTRLTLLERQIDTSQLSSLHPRLNRVEDAITELKAISGKLGTLDVIVTRLNMIAELVEGFVPRTEHQIRWAADQRRIEALEARATQQEHGYDTRPS